MCYKRMLAVLAILAFLIVCHEGTSCQKQGMTVLPPQSGPTAGGVIADNNHLYWGIVSDTGIMLDKKYYVINFDCATKIPRWVAYNLSKSDLLGKKRGCSNFVLDPDVSKKCQARNDDYKNNCYDKGHMAPKADFRRSKEAYCSTYLFSNASPQDASFNQGTWESIESAVRKSITLTGQGWIITGNLFLSADSHMVVPNCFIGPHLVAVPTHLFKAVLTMSPDSEFAAYGYLAPNCFPPKGAKAVKYLISIDRLEDITGYDFFPNLPDSIEASIESVGPRRSATVAKRNAPR